MTGATRGNLIRFLCILSFIALGVFAESRFEVSWRLKSLLNSKPRGAIQVALPQFREIESALLPLKLETVKIGVEKDFAPEAGALCSFDKYVVISDRQAHFYSYSLEDKVAHRPAWPALDNHYAEFLKTPKAKYNYFFRVHGLACPIWKNQRRIIAVHEAFDVDAQLTRYTVSMLSLNNKLESTDTAWRVLYQSDPVKYQAARNYGGHTAGGRVVYHDDNLYLSIGQYGLTLEEQAGNDPNLGSIIRLDLKTGAASQISSGHRNPQGLARLASGEILSTEHGPRGGDELNLIEQGSNYGWPSVTYGTEYETYAWPANAKVGRHDGFKKPLFAWVPSLGISQLVQATNFHPRWNSDLLIASLKAGTLSRLRYEEGGVRYVEPIWIGPRLRDIVETEDHRIAFWTDGGELLLLSIDDDAFARNTRAMHSVLQPANVTCMTCHHGGPTNPTHVAPSLSKLMGRAIASDNFANYSASLKAKGGVWSEESLRSFLRAPQEFAPGTSMAIPEMTKKELDQVITFLKALD